MAGDRGAIVPDAGGHRRLTQAAYRLLQGVCVRRHPPQTLSGSHPEEPGSQEIGHCTEAQQHRQGFHHGPKPAAKADELM